MNNPGDIVRKKEKLVDLAETTASTSTYNNNEVIFLNTFKNF